MAYFSRAFQKGEKNKAIIEKELLAIYHAITFFKPYVYGTHFEIFSDHKPLAFLFNMKKPTSKLVRIRMDLEEFDFDITYIPGRFNYTADALSRIHITDLKKMADVNDAQILAITRSMGKKKAKHENEQTVVEKESMVYEDLAIYNKKIPRLRSQMTIKNLNMTHEYTEIRLRAHRGHKCIFDVATNVVVVNDRRFILDTLSLLETTAIELKINEIQLSKDDDMFQNGHCTVEEFISICNEELKYVKIALVTPPEIIRDESKKLELIRQYHDDKMFGGHCGQKKLYNY